MRMSALARSISSRGWTWARTARARSSIGDEGSATGVGAAGAGDREGDETSRRLLAISRRCYGAGARLRVLDAMSSGQHAIDYAAVAHAHAEVARAMAVAREAGPVLDLVVARVTPILDLSHAFVIMVKSDQRLRVVAGSGLKTRLREVWTRHERDGLAMI